MSWTFNPFTGNFDFFWRPPDISGGLDNLLLVGDDDFLLIGATDDVLLLV